MKLTKSQLKQIIKEELESAFKELSEISAACAKGKKKTISTGPEMLKHFKGAAEDWVKPYTAEIDCMRKECEEKNLCYDEELDECGPC